VFLSLIAFGGKSMAFGKIYLSSAVTGLVLKNGEPVENVEITRRLNWHWGIKKISDAANTNSKGQFVLDEQTASSLTARIMPHEPVVEQRITLMHDGVEYKGWFYTKHNYDNNGEIDGKPLNFTCELTEDSEYRKAYGVREAFGICRFD
jgi:hypothetical protein